MNSGASITNSAIRPLMSAPRWSTLAVNLDISHSLALPLWAQVMCWEGNNGLAASKMTVSDVWYRSTIVDFDAEVSAPLS